MYSEDVFYRLGEDVPSKPAVVVSLLLPLPLFEGDSAEFRTARGDHNSGDVGGDARETVCFVEKRIYRRVTKVPRHHCLARAPWSLPLSYIRSLARYYRPPYLTRGLLVA